MDDRLKAFFDPKGVVVVGASREKNKLGYGVARNLIASGYQGQIALLNPKGGELFGYQLFSSLQEVPFTPNLAIIVVAAKYVPDTLIACSQKGVRSVVIISGGFREAGEEGLLLEEKCKAIALEKGLRIIGPNCIGVVDTHAPLDTTFIQPPMPNQGEIAFISQSGALGAAVIDWAREEGFGFSQVVSLGNQIDVSEADMLEAASLSENTSVITMYLESIQDGASFLQKAAEVSKVKPIIALKVGRSEAGAKAASSHTGALAGANSAYDSAFRKSGVLQAASIEEMFEWAKAFAWTNKLPAGPRIAVLTNAGGPGVTAADAISKTGLQMADLSEETLKALSEQLPAAASVYNPIDMLASASPKTYANCLNTLLSDTNVDMVLVIAPPPPMFEALDVAKELAPIIQSADKPVVISFMGSTLVREAVDYVRDQKILEYRFPERAVGAMAAMESYQRILGRSEEIFELEADHATKEDVKAVFREYSDYKGFLPAVRTDEILSAYGIHTLALKFAETKQDALKVASGVGYPVVLKLASDEFSHKSDVGGVILGLNSAEELGAAFEKLMEDVAEKGIDHLVQGVNIQKMVSGGQEVIVGAMRDPVFGALLMFGSGGVEVEGLHDIQFSVIPPAEYEIEYLLENTWAGQKLNGFRNFSKADIKALKDIFYRLSQLMLDHPEISELEINPVIVMSEGQGAFAVDGRILL